MQIAIVGGGPIGSYCGALLAGQGHEVDIYEEHREIGKPVQCTGITTASILSMISIKEDIILNRVNTARIFSPENKYIDVRMEEDNIVIDRTKFDQMLVRRAQEAGCRLHTGKRVTDMAELPQQIIIGADGPLSSVAKWFGIYGERKQWIGVQARVKLNNENYVEFYPHIGTYGWVVPEDTEHVRIGLAAMEKPHEQFTAFLKQRLGDNEIIEHQGGLIPWYDPKAPVFAEKDGRRCYLIGDAGTHVKATTGGGYIHGMLAAQAVAESLQTGKSYEKLCKKKTRNDLWLHLKMRHVMDKFSFDDWNKLIHLFSRPKTKKIIEKFDRSYPSQFLLKLCIIEPRVLTFAKYLVKKVP